MDDVVIGCDHIYMMGFVLVNIKNCHTDTKCNNFSEEISIVILNLPQMNLTACL